ncbi:MAG: hypothetical protein ACT4PJ_17310 [Gemmatimonadaceae bacterium]
MSPASNPSGAPLPSVAMLGADALLAARPATPVQLAHACQAAGYAAAYPVTWGDELLAAACARRVATRGDDPAIFCACPHVSDALLEVGPDLARFLVPLVPPPVACARYLRALYGYGRVRITYIGACPGAHDPAIDAHLSPIQFLGVLAQLGVVLHEQPDVFDSVLPPDRRRYRSVPGGAPTSEMLRLGGSARTLHEIIEADWKTELAQRLLSRERALFDVAPALGCHCSGARPGVIPTEARAAVVALEPPRAPSDVIDLNVAVDVDRGLPVVTPRPQSATVEIAIPSAPPDEGGGLNGRPVEPAPVSEPVLAAPSPVAEPAPVVEEPEPIPVDAARRRTAAPVVAHAAQAVPVTRTESGQVLPRAYAARRRAPSNGATAVSPETLASPAVIVTEPESVVTEPERIVAEAEVTIALTEPATETPPVPAAAEAPATESAPLETPPPPRQTPRSVVVPIPAQELRPVPPPPAGDHGRAAVVTAVATVAVAIAAYVASRGNDGRISEESSGVAAPPSSVIDSLPLVFPLADSVTGNGSSASDTTSVERSASSPDSAAQSSITPAQTDSVLSPARVETKRPRRRAIRPRRRPTESSTTSSAAAVADSLAREWEAIRRELEERRARLDTIARSLRPDPDRPQL